MAKGPIDRVVMRRQVVAAFMFDHGGRLTQHVREQIASRFDCHAQTIFNDTKVVNRGGTPLRLDAEGRPLLPKRVGIHEFRPGQFGGKEGVPVLNETLTANGTTLVSLPRTSEGRKSSEIQRTANEPGDHSGATGETWREVAGVSPTTRLTDLDLLQALNIIGEKALEVVCNEGQPTNSRVSAMKVAKDVVVGMDKAKRVLKPDGDQPVDKKAMAKRTLDAMNKLPAALRRKVAAGG